MQSFRSDTALLLILLLYAFNHLSAPLGRITPIEALPISCERSRTRNSLHKGFHPLTLTRDVSLDLLLATLGADFYFAVVICSVWLCQFLTPHSSLKNPLYALSTLSRFVVPLIPSGTPAVITTRSPFLRYPSSTERSSACLISSSVLVFSSIIPACMPHERFSW